MNLAFIAQPIDPVLPPDQNSIGIWTYEVSRRLAKSHDVQVYLRNNGFKGKKSVRINSVKFNAVSLRFDNRVLPYLERFSGRFDAKSPLFASRLYYLGYLLQIALSLRKEQCDIVHIHNFSQFVPIIKAINPNVKIVLHMHCEWLTQLKQKMIERRLRDVDLIISCSKYITQKTRLAFPQFAHRCHTVYNGIDVTDFFSDNKRGIATENEGHKKILFVGRISPEKGIHILLDAFKKVLERYPKLDLHLVGPQTPAPLEYIISLSDDPKVLELSTFYSGGYLAHLNKKISQNLVNRVTFHKYIPYSDLINFYHSAHMFVFPSVWDEPFGMPIIEAMACGLPVVATRGGGIPEIVEHGKTGLLVEKGDSNGLADAMRGLLGNEHSMQPINEAGRQRVVERFSWDRTSEDLLAAYRKLHL